MSDRTHMNSSSAYLAETIWSQYLQVITQAENELDISLPRFRSAEMSLVPNQHQGLQKPNYFKLPDLSAHPFWSLERLPSVVQDELQRVQRSFHQLEIAYRDALPNIEFTPGRTGYFGRSVDWKHNDVVLKDGTIADELDRLYPVLYRFCRVLLNECYLSGTYFAAMAPGCHLRAHCGAFNHLLRLHLGLVIPKGDCALVVNGEKRRWQLGRWLCFDDTFQHEAWNRTPASRHVLLARLLHPELSKNERRAYQLIERNPLFWATYTELTKQRAGLFTDEMKP
jgi:hypothetical protein